MFVFFFYEHTVVLELNISMTTCACPGCDQPGTNGCASCRLVGYCSRVCQTADWLHHKEECPGHLRKMGMSHLNKAEKFSREQNWLQSLRYSDLALTKLQQLKDHPLAVIELLDDAFKHKGTALIFMGRQKEHLECATERYNMWETTFRRHPKTIEVSFALIEVLMFDNELDKAHLIAGMVYEQTTHPMTNDIPEELQQPLLAEGSCYYARATLSMAQAGGIPPEEEQKVGEEAIALARKAVQIDTHLHGTESLRVANDMATLASVLDHFNNVDDDEILRLYERAMATYRRLEGNMYLGVAGGETSLGCAYYKRADRAEDAGDLDRCVINGELAATHYREAARIIRAINHVDTAEPIATLAAEIEENMRQIRTSITATTA